MQHTRSTISTTTHSVTRLAAALGATLVLAACGAAVTADSSPADPTIPSTAAADTTPDTTPETTTAATPVPTVAPATSAPVTVPPATVAAGTVATTSPPTTVDPTPTTLPPPVEPVTCGDFGPIPPRPDSMPTVLMDTDGDGDTDEVTAYGAPDGWRVRIVENGLTSEALVESIAGWAYLAEPIPDPAGAIVVLVDNDTEQAWHFTTGDDGCIAPIDPPLVTVDDLVAPDEADDELVCGPLPAIPDDAIVGEPFWFDLNGDGVADDLLVTYLSGDMWTLRSELQTWEGGPIAQSEIEIPGAGVHGVEVIGFADVDDTYGGEEVLVKVGGGASSVEIGIFSWLEGGCLFQYQGGVDATPFTSFVGETIGHGEGLVCGDGYLLRWGWSLNDDGTYSYHDAAFEVVSFGTFGYMPASDGFDEALTADELPATIFDCAGLSL